MVQQIENIYSLGSTFRSAVVINYLNGITPGVEYSISIKHLINYYFTLTSKLTQRTIMVRDLTVSSLHPSNTKTRWTPPFQRIPVWEKRFWGVFMFTGILAVPAYILYHLPDYRGGVGPHVSYLRKQAREAAKAES